ncbi:hypothetical protein [Saccharothrix sp. Mg75]|uniref:hypothetical protein n=1 Tax=Saccharothrix sp. Mg75 TaxID=3445357 RepID=UPI003EED58E4
MSVVTIRRFRWTTRPGPDGYPVVDEVEAVGPHARLPVNIAELVYVNAMAPAAPARVRYDTRVNELRLLQNHLGTDPTRRLTLRQDDFRAGSMHIRRFVSETFGLGMLTAAVQSAYEWTAGADALSGFDALPMTLAASSRKNGVRPDLLFRAPGVLLAGEARGRSSNPPRSTRLQRERLNRLLPWAHLHDHPLVMTWAYLTGGGVTADFFVPRDQVDWLSGPIGHGDADALPAIAHPVAAVREEVDVTGRPSPDRTSPVSLFEVGGATLRGIEEQLFESAPVDGAVVASRPARGRWVQLDPVDPSRGSLLLALLDEPLTPAESTAAARRWRERDGNGLAVTAHHRVVVAVTEDRRGQPWDLVAD